MLLESGILANGSLLQQLTTARALLEWGLLLKELQIKLFWTDF